MSDDDGFPHLLGRDDAELLGGVSGVDRRAFGILYLRHHEAVWRVANVVSGFSPAADVAVIEAFARVLHHPSTVPSAGSLRPQLWRAAREIALRRSRGGHAGQGRERAAPASLPVGPDRQVDLTEPSLGAVDLLRQLVEPERTALWLCDVEAATPKEAAAVLHIDRGEAARLAARGRVHLRLALLARALEESSAACRPTLERLTERVLSGDDDAIDDGDLPHLAGCAVCRMRRAEVLDLRRTLCQTVRPAPLLGGECQRRWLRLAGREQRRHPSRRRRTTTAAAGMLLVAVLVLPRLGSSPAAHRHATEVAGVTVTTEPVASGESGVESRDRVAEAIAGDEARQAASDPADGHGRTRPGASGEPRTARPLALLDRVLAALPEATNRPFGTAEGIYVDAVLTAVVTADHVYAWSEDEEDVGRRRHDGDGTGRRLTGHAASGYRALPARVLGDRDALRRFLLQARERRQHADASPAPRARPGGGSPKRSSSGSLPRQRGEDR